TLLDGHFRRWAFSSNILINPQGSPPSMYPAGQYWVSSLAAVGFQDPSKADFALSAKSPYRGHGSGGSDPGANVKSLFEAFTRFMSAPDFRRDQPGMLRYRSGILGHEPDTFTGERTESSQTLCVHHVHAHGRRWRRGRGATPFHSSLSGKSSDGCDDGSAGQRARIPAESRIPGA